MSTKHHGSKGGDLLTLSMIVKDEARTIERTLASVKPFIDRWIILDTGSTDATRDVIRRAMEGVPGEVLDEPFVDFETTRNLGLERCGEATEFILWLDADDELQNGAALRAFLERERKAVGPDREVYLVRLDTGVRFDSPRVARSRAGWRFKGAVHEILQHPQRLPPSQRVPDAWIKHHPDLEAGERSRRRWERDIGLLGRAVERDPTDARAAFYLALTYVWLGRLDEAAPALRRRIDLGGWTEEVYQAKMALAEISERRGAPWAETLELFLDAHAYAPHRAEPLYHIALHYNALGQHALCMVFARRGLDIPLPEKELLFVDEAVYRWKMADLVGSSAFWVGEFALGEEAARKALRHQPGDARLEQNLGFYLDRKRKERPRKGR